MDALKSCSNTWFVETIGKERIQSLILTGECKISHYRKGQTIHAHMSTCETLDLILSGCPTVNRLDFDGNIVHITLLTTCDTIGGILLFATQNTYPFDVSALEDTTLLQIKKDSFLALLRELPNLLPYFLNDISDKTTRLTQSIHTLSEKSLRTKIIQYFRQETALQKSTHIQLRHTKTLLAERFGVARTSLSRELKNMQDEGLIYIDGQTISIHIDLNF